MSPERVVSIGSRGRTTLGDVASLDDPRYSTCFVCNKPMAYAKLRPGIAWADDHTTEGDINLWAVFAHPDCLRKVAHPDFDLNKSAATGLEE